MAKKILSGFLSMVFACILMGGSAQATPLFQAGEYPASITGTSQGTHVFMSSPGAMWKCGNKSTMTGSISESSSTITLTPNYTDCTLLETPMTVKTNGCSYRFHLGEGSNTFDIVCPAGQSIEFSYWGGCVWRFLPQQGVAGVSATVNKAANPLDVTLAINTNELTHTEEGFTFPCRYEGTFEKGVYTTNVTLRADGPGGNLVPFWVA